ncbi:Diphthamide biosynthesis protein 2 [Marasmius tenuissimus]|uniref:2-(3-amino-3-carboxypropyl)histidine synthase subunit 2 n=1 Tax=Marasmius tenuissimus TaxID=585030 RepID=A0ABR2ZZ22_9AGAR
MTDGFSTSSSEAISRTLDVHIDPQLSPKEDFDDFYEIERVAREITEGDFNRITYAHLILNFQSDTQNSPPNSFPPPPLPLPPLPPPKEDPTPETETIFYIGPSTSLTLTNILITHPSSTVYSYNPATRTTHLESSHTSKSLMRRYATLQKARDADVFGILVGTLGVASYLPLLTHIRTTLTRSRKKSYTISVGKLNPSKLANFMEIECFVLVACPENSLIDSKEFYRPIVTPYELQVALRDEPSWLEGSYVFDFGRLLASSPPQRNEEDEDEDQPVFSLITGKYRHAKRYGTNTTTAPENENENSTALIGNDNGGRGSLTKFTSSSAASQFLLHSRTYQGLEPRLGEDDPGVLEQGRKGVARGYGEV